jgi:hypothetical protein
MKLVPTFLAVTALSVSAASPAAAAPAGAKDPAKVVERATASMNELPRLVRESLEDEAEGGSIEELQKEFHEDHSVTYDAEIVRDGKVTYVNVGSDGTINGHAKPRPPRRGKD